MLFLYACSKISFRILAFAACVLGISNISDTAWRKQFPKSVPFLHEILHSMPSSFISFRADKYILKEIKNVLLIDASVIRQEGKQQEQQPDVILCITPKCFCLHDAYGNKIPLIQLLKKAEEKHIETVNISGFCKYRKKSALVHVVAGR